MIDIVDITGKKVIFIDELSFGFPLDIGCQIASQRRTSSTEELEK